MTMGVYKLVFRNGEFYVGSSMNIEQRFKYHLRMLRTGKHDGPKLQNAYNKHGLPVCHVFLICDGKALLKAEQRCIDELKPKYNTSLLAGKVFWTVEMRREFSKKQKLRLADIETRQRMSESAKMRPPNRKNCKMAEEVKRKISATRKERKIRSPALGKRLSDAAKLKLSISAQGRIVSEETKKKLRIARAGKKPMLGKSHSEIAKLRMKSSQLARRRRERHESR